MKKLITYLIIFNLVFTGILIFLPDNVKAVITEKLIVNWEDINAGLKEGYNDNMTFKCIDDAG